MACRKWRRNIGEARRNRLRVMGSLGVAATCGVLMSLTAAGEPAVIGSSGLVGDVVAVPTMPGDPPCPADITGDGVVDVLDLLEVLGQWGPCPQVPGMTYIPGGEFDMGCHAETGETCKLSELPVHDVCVDSFHLAVYETTTEQYCTFLNAALAQELIEVTPGGEVRQMGTTLPYCDTSDADEESRIHWDGSTFTVEIGKEDHPMVLVSWYGAAAYCNWRSAEEGLQPAYDLETWTCDWDADAYRLPTEAEWEYAARGGEYDPYYAYPWGDDIDGSMANFSGSGDPFESGPYPWTTPVGYYDGGQTPPGDDMANGYGLYDMAGNVAEMCSDWWDWGYYSSCPDDNPHGPPSGVSRSKRNGAWQSSPTGYLRSAAREGIGPQVTVNYVGFRVARVYAKGAGPLADPPCPADITGDGVVDVLDLLEILGAWGPCPEPPPPPPGMMSVPAGEFAMGCHAETGESCKPEELPLHDVFLDAFYIAAYETTNEEYCAFLNYAYPHGMIEVEDGVVYKIYDTEPYCDTTSSASVSRIQWDYATGTFSVTPGKEDHPMLRVSWYGAAAYCNWRSAQEQRRPVYDLETWTCDWSAHGYRLPTEAEWEYAARGGQHNPYYTFPWGNEIDGSMANYSSSGDPFESGPYPWTTPVGYYDGGQIPPGVDMANGYGLYDVAGNVFEWCHDWYDATYYVSSPYDNPCGPDTGTYRVVRGGSWVNSWINLRCALRGWGTPDYLNLNWGFRVLLANP